MLASVYTFIKPCSLIFLDTYEQNKTKKILHTILDIAKEITYGKIQRKGTLHELELQEVFVGLNKRPDLWKSKIIYIIFHCRTIIIA